MFINSTLNYFEIYTYRKYFVYNEFCFYFSLTLKWISNLESRYYLREKYYKHNSSEKKYTNLHIMIFEKRDYELDVVHSFAVLSLAIFNVLNYLTRSRFYRPEMTEMLLSRTEGSMLLK